MFAFHIMRRKDSTTYYFLFQKFVHTLNFKQDDFFPIKIRIILFCSPYNIKYPISCMKSHVRYNNLDTELQEIISLVF